MRWKKMHRHRRENLWWRWARGKALTDKPTIPAWLIVNKSIWFIQGVGTYSINTRGAFIPGELPNELEPTNE